MADKIEYISQGSPHPEAAQKSMQNSKGDRYPITPLKTAHRREVTSLIEPNKQLDGGYPLLLLLAPYSCRPTFDRFKYRHQNGPN